MRIEVFKTECNVAGGISCARTAIAGSGSPQPVWRAMPGFMVCQGGCLWTSFCGFRQNLMSGSHP